ncbi:pterocarpan synthase 1-like [Oryza glaberrima]|uniref:Dirigent protein n=1 Tax=Oryza glaberrima TaxID=4538 RepID=I1QYM3_ORYGL|nr:pterocarpan synthase 1-like [Oryza glaberrima]
MPLLLQLALAVAVAVAMAGTATTTTTHTRFYMHDTVTASASGGGPAATAVRVVRGAAAAALPGDAVNRFGDLYAVDDPLTDGADAPSAAVGRARGFYMFASRTDSALLFSATMEFTAGVHRGGAVSVLARDAILDEVRELPVVGGAGVLRGAAGYGLLRTHSFNATTNNAVLQIDMYLTV